MDLRFNVTTRIQKPVSEVFDAVYNPAKLKEYFATGAVSGPPKEGEKVSWRFGEFPEMDVVVEVKEVVVNELIAFQWPSAEGGHDTQVEIGFEAKGPNETLVRISESGWKETEKGLASSYNNCQGWAQMISALKAFAEYGINLRRGAYHPEDFKAGS